MRVPDDFEEREGTQERGSGGARRSVLDTDGDPDPSIERHRARRALRATLHHEPVDALHDRRVRAIATRDEVGTCTHRVEARREMAGERLVA